ncbi:hypothetical protein AWC38_SpisGene24593 [Stylophora pistillata]|uniref:Uncharacterized protein n=1 Tax=Stylophora pistillata TaxID=50429 RepID=A0A2B4R482_STYPI|nr:hypothetical protein AWC38_SpisGene24593 [Stylophora pistillata]
MLRRLFSFRRTKQEDDENVKSQKENVDPNSQLQESSPPFMEANQPMSSILKSTSDIRVIGESSEDEGIDAHVADSVGKLEDRAEERNLVKKNEICELCLVLESSTLSDTERCNGETKDCESIKDEVSLLDESERCDSSTSAEDKDESGIEQDFEPAIANQTLSTNTKQSTTELKPDPANLNETADSSRMTLNPINLKSHLIRNDRIKTLNRNSQRVPDKMKQRKSSCNSSPEKFPSFVSPKAVQRQLLSQRVQYSRGFSIKSTPRQVRQSKVPELFGDIVIKDQRSATSKHPSPLRKGILKYPSNSKSSAAGVRYAPAIPKKNKALSQKGKKMSMSSDSGLSDNEGSSGDEQKRIPVKKIFSNQQALRKRIDDLNGMLKTMEQQRSELQAVLQIVKDWTEDLRAVNRTNLGVPYIRAIKQLLETKEKWIDFVLAKRKNWQPGKTPSLCSIYFRGEDFQFRLDSKMRRCSKTDEVGICVNPLIHAGTEVEEPPSQREKRMLLRSAKARLKSLDAEAQTSVSPDCMLLTP